jgi:glycosyltransferase involved in cell wall biosynthesis
MKPVLSICMMVKNEEGNLVRCLESLKPLMAAVPSELIVVDTGSDDDTVAIARRYTDKIYFHPWNDNFSAMRNITIGYATGTWVLIIDADEELTKTDGLIGFFGKKHPANVGGAAMLVKNYTSAQAYVVLISVRLFRRAKDFRYQGVVHNSPVFKGTVEAVDSTLSHYGYISEDKELMERKFARTGALLRQELEKDPENIYYRYQLSVSYSMHQDWEESYEEICKAYDLLKTKGLEPSRYIYIYCQYAKACIRRSLFKRAIEICREGIALEPEYIDLYFYMAQAHAILRNFDDATANYERYLALVQNFDRLRIKYNPVINHHTISVQKEAVYNLAALYNKNGDYRRSLDMLKLLAQQDSYMAEKSLLLLAEAAFKLADFTFLMETYVSLQQASNEKLVAVLTNSIESCKNVQLQENYQRFAATFAALGDDYGELNKMRREYLNENHLGKTRKALLASWDFNSLPDYYGDIIYYAVADFSFAADLFSRISEPNIIRFFKYLDTYYRKPFTELIKANAGHNPASFREVRLQRHLLKYLLFSGELNDQEYRQYFSLYLCHGSAYIKALYNPTMISADVVYDVKNVEEAMLVYLVLAETEKDNQVKYVQYLQKALDIYPEMNKGIRLLLDAIREEPEKRTDEINRLKKELMQQIHILVANKEFAAAKQIIAEAEKIVGLDVELLAAKTTIEANYN